MGIYRNFTHKDCIDPSISQFPKFLIAAPPRYDLSFYSLFLTILVFIAMTIVCDDYFVPAVEAVCLNVGMSPDVVGATFMAATTSAPEFFVDCVATFITEGDIGIGTIVGSSIFNLLVIPGICAIVIPEPYTIDWWPIVRDMLWYIASVVILVLVVHDDEILLVEAVVLFLPIVINWTTLIYDKEIQVCVRGKLVEVIENPMEETETEPFKIFALPRNTNIIQKIYWLLVWPWQLLFFLTIPNIKRPFTKKWHWIELIFSTLWIMILSYLITWFLTIFGYYNQIPDSVMGLTILAAGTSVPELLSSYLIARKGSAYGAMAFCNAISSNTFDIFVCLGLPWIIKLIIDVEQGKDVVILLDSSGLFYVVALLLLSVAVVFVLLLCNHFKLTRAFGINALLLYLLFIIVSCAVELNIFGVLHKPTCPFTG